jgi:hypothetical protein
MTQPITFAIPGERELSRAQGWTRDATRARRYWAVRRHLALFERQVDGTPRCGDVVGVAQPQAYLEQESSEVGESEQTVVRWSEWAAQTLAESEAVDEASASIGAQLSASGLSTLSSQIGATLKQRLLQSLGDSLKAQASETCVAKKRVEHKRRVLPAQSGEQVTYVDVLVYTRRAYDIYLYYVDYLCVDYAAAFLSTRRFKVQKTPPFCETQRRPPNAIRCGLPLASLQFWHLLDQTIPIKVGDLRKPVVDPYEIALCALEAPRNVFAVPVAPSLYALSSRAFPERGVAAA